MKKILLPSIFLLAISFNTFSFERGKMERPDINTLVTELQLGEDESSQLMELMELHREKMDFFHKSRKEKHEEMRSLHEQHREQLYALLGAEKMYLFENYMRKFHPRPPGRR